MDRSGEEGSESPRIDVNALPDSLVRLWDTMLRIDPTWDLSGWLEERADEELELGRGSSRTGEIETRAATSSNRDLGKEIEEATTSCWTRFVEGPPSEKSLRCVRRNGYLKRI